MQVFIDGNCLAWSFSVKNKRKRTWQTPNWISQFWIFPYVNRKITLKNRKVSCCSDESWQAQKQNSRLIWWLQFYVTTNTLLLPPHPSPPPPNHKTKSKEGLFNFIVKMLYCRDQADDLIGCIIIIMFEIINSQQEALHHYYEMYSVVLQTLLHAGKSPFFQGSWVWAREI